jgi:hypothetical protein
MGGRPRAEAIPDSVDCFAPYAAASVASKNSHVRKFVAYCRLVGVDLSHVPLSAIRGFVRTLVDDEFLYPAVRQYCRSVMDFLLLNDALIGNVWGDKFLEVVFRHAQIECCRRDPKKAMPFSLEAYRKLGVRNRAILLFWLSSGLRVSSLLSLQPQYLHRVSDKVMKFVVPAVKCSPIEGVSTLTIRCSCRIRRSEFCVVHGPHVSTFLPLNRSALCLLVSQLPGGCSMHSPRRTVCLYLRILMETKGFRLSVARINRRLLWSPRSKEFFSYSKDWELFRRVEFPILDGVLWEVMLDSDEDEVFDKSSGFVVISR